MARTRLSLHEILCELLGSRNCYFSPPASIHLDYPCIIYREISTDVDHADNLKYRTMNRYSVTVIDEDPDSDIPERILQLPYCSSDRDYQADGLNHWVFTLFW